jgi:hypothetical protein
MSTPKNKLVILNVVILSIIAISLIFIVFFFLSERYEERKIEKQEEQIVISRQRQLLDRIYNTENSERKN